MQMGSRFRKPRYEAPRGFCRRAWAYQDVLNDAPVALLVVRRARQPRTFSSGHRKAAAFVTRIGISVQIWSDLGLVISKSTQCVEAQGDCFAHLSFYSSFATVTRLGTVPLNLKGINSPFATAAHKGFPIVLLLCPKFCLGRPKKSFRPSELDFFVSRVCKGEGFEGFDIRLGFVLSLVYLLETPRLCIAWSLWCALPYFKCKVDPWEVPSSSAQPMECRAWRTFNFGSPVIATLERLDCD
ncbi:hypothetical protein CRG98_012834 [Punica granatum]|uniref:Uncharacterized protein n=1 Tax=Punica granatum TaxID=22663 RepID=A0A2I0KE92_PUNGR|nr:hypothetical protein CRG98_012834 [Punica granatum]